MVGWHHRLNGQEFEKTLGDGEGQGSLACCSPLGCKEWDTTLQLYDNNHNKSSDSGNPVKWGDVLGSAGQLLPPSSNLEPSPVSAVFPTTVGFKPPQWSHGHTLWAEGWLSYSSFSIFLSLKKKKKTDSTIFKITITPTSPNVGGIAQVAPPTCTHFPLGHSHKAVAPFQGYHHPAYHHSGSLLPSDWLGTKFQTPSLCLLHMTQSGGTVLVWGSWEGIPGNTSVSRETGPHKACFHLTRTWTRTLEASGHTWDEPAAPGVTELGVLTYSLSAIADALRRYKSPGTPGLPPKQVDQALVAKKAKAGGWPGGRKGSAEGIWALPTDLMRPEYCECCWLFSINYGPSLKCNYKYRRECKFLIV